MICWRHHLEHLLVRATDWLMECRIELHARNHPEPPSPPEPAVEEVEVQPPAARGIAVFDHCLYCNLTRAAGVSNHCPRCGCEAVEAMPTCMMGGAS